MLIYMSCALGYFTHMMSTDKYIMTFMFVMLLCVLPSIAFGNNLLASASLTSQVEGVCEPTWRAHAHMREPSIEKYYTFNLVEPKVML